MNISIYTFLIVCPLVGLAGFVDAIGGGGGLISLPAYLLAGIPAHNAIATNKLSSACGTALATGRFIKNGLVNFVLAIPAVISAIIGSYIGAHLSMRISERVLSIALLVLLPIVAFIVLNKKIFKDNENEKIELNRKTVITTIISALVIGMYDGFYGPGTGTFLIIAFTVAANMGMKVANAQAKVINLTTNITSLVVFLLNGHVMVSLGLAAAVCNMIGGYLGAGLVMKNSSKIIRPIVTLVLIILAVNVVTKL